MEIRVLANHRPLRNHSNASPPDWGASQVPRTGARITYHNPDNVSCIRVAQSKSTVS
jgi:hypothetical protein